MGAVLKGSIGLAILVTLVSIVIGLTGLHQNPIAGGLGFLVVAIGANIAAVFWVLRQTAADNGYGKQLLNALLVGLVAGVLIFGSSWILLTVVFPDNLDEAVEANIDLLRQSGMPEEQLQPRIERLEATTVVGQSFAGLMGTFFTSLIVGAIVAIFQRKK